MKRVMLALTVIVLVVAGTSAAFADNEARDAMIAYSGTDAFAKLLPEERQACMYWVAEGGKMSEACRSAVVRLITDAPDAVTPSQRRALLEAASGTDEVASKKPGQPPAPVPDNKPTVEKSDNTGALVAVGVIAVIAGLIIRNNWSSHKDSSPSQSSPPPHHHPAPPHHDRRPPGR